MVPGERSVATGQAALSQGDWVTARAAFEASLAGGETAEALAGLAEALWWLGETRASVDARERAYAAYRRDHDHAEAANLAIALSVHYDANLGNASAASGWLARARRLVDEHGIDELQGWVMLLSAGEAAEPARMEELTRETLVAARAVGDLDLELCALAQLGSCLVAQGRIEEGTALLDEAMAGSLGGEGGSFDTVVFTSCNMIASCTRSADFDRAVQWIDAADRFTERYGCPFLYLYCRVHYGEILIAIGDWPAAEAQLISAIRETEGSQRALHADARAALASLRLAQGRLEDAEELLRGLDGHGRAAPVTAAIHLARGAPEVAEVTAERALEEADLIGRGELIELLGDAELALGRGEAAAARARALLDAIDDPGCEIVRARGQRLLGRAIAAREPLDAAIAGFARLTMPYEVARTRLLLAEVVRHTEPELTRSEARTALSAFEDLDAGRDADAAAAFLRALGVKAARLGPRGLNALTKRETEVLQLVAEGLSNPEIAQRLYLSRKTVEHHVASILTKLGAKNRADALRIAARAAPTADPVTG